MKKTSNALTPMYPFEFVDQFNQKIVFGGMSKIEFVAMELYKQRIDNDTFGDLTRERLLVLCYNDAIDFCEYNLDAMIDKF